MNNHFVARGVVNGVFVLKVYVLMTAAVTFSSVDATQDNTICFASCFLLLIFKLGSSPSAWKHLFVRNCCDHEYRSIELRWTISGIFSSLESVIIVDIKPYITQNSVRVPVETSRRPELLDNEHTLIHI